MKLPHGILRAALAALILALTGCALTNLLSARLEKPAFTYRGTELVEASQGKVAVNFLFIAHNPNAAGLKNVTCAYELFVEGKKVLTGKDLPLQLNPKGDTEITVPATIAYEDLVPVLGSLFRRLLSGQKTIPITIKAVFSGKPALYGEAGKEERIFFEMSLNKTVDIPFPVNKSRGP